MRKRTRRKVWALVNPIEHAMRGVSVVEDRVTLSQNNWRLFHDLREGKVAQRGAFDRLTLAILVGDRLRKFDLAPDHLTTFGRAMIAINAIRDRKTSSTRAYYLATGVELEALREALLVHDVQLQHCSVSELQEAWRVIEAQEQTAKGAMRSGKRGVVSQGTDSVRA